LQLDRRPPPFVCRRLQLPLEFDVGRADAELKQSSAQWAAEGVRTSDGAWRVLRDLTDAPSGAGYALLNRTVLARLFPDEHRYLGVLRLNAFFSALRSALAALAPEDRPDSRTVVLTSGLGHPSYFEHSYLAEQLGYNLAEGGDLTVRHGRVWLRSLGGLEPVDVLLRRIDDADADPLELGDGNGKGVPGLLHASRLGTIGLANALGSGAAGELALQPFLGRACQALLGQPLRLPALETRWCGDPDERAEVVDRFDAMVVHESRPDGEPRTLFVDDLGEAERDALLARLRATPSVPARSARGAVLLLPSARVTGLSASAKTAGLAIQHRSGVSKNAKCWPHTARKPRSFARATADQLFAGLLTSASEDC
jgi:uncharacterized circularly permuted ATP-grasp superfamily protein